jgi:3-hydroxyisobutyrate dehydrogenase-like beta-hydroxyacid dehydrogenase
MSGTDDAVGFIGLGNMGSALCANLVSEGLDVWCFDRAGAERAPEGARVAESVSEVASNTTVMVLSLPDGHASASVAGEIIATRGCSVTDVLDTSTIGPQAAIEVESLLASAGISLIDAPVSGGPAGARARTLAVMYGGSDAACARAGAVLGALSDQLHRVAQRPGPAQAMKLANNFLSATALAATSEAIAFGMASGLEMGTMLEVLNGASGRSAATSDKFPTHVLTGRYASGFSNTLMAKDLRLYLASVDAIDAPEAIGPISASLWERFATAEPDVDFTRIFPYVEGL